MIADPSNLICESCNSTMQRVNKPWHFVCKSCGLERSTLEASINLINVMDEGARERALKPIRQQNFKVLLRWMVSLANSIPNSGNQKTLLDVGCAHGWFLEIASENYYVLGLEPDINIVVEANKRNLNIRNGFFPSDLKTGEVFDAIVFNDVFEHIPGALETLVHCEKKLSKNGIIIVNAPNSRGIFYKAAKMLAFLGFNNSFDRLWQAGLPSPHLYYFNDVSIRNIANKAGFKVVGKISLPSIVAKGLFSRINFAGNKSKIWSYSLFMAIFLLIPILRIFPSDISAWALMRKTDTF